MSDTKSNGEWREVPGYGRRWVYEDEEHGLCHAAGPNAALGLPLDEHVPNIHERPTKRGPFSPFDWADNRTPTDHHEDEQR